MFSSTAVRSLQRLAPATPRTDCSDWGRRPSQSVFRSCSQTKRFCLGGSGFVPPTSSSGRHTVLRKALGGILSLVSDRSRSQSAERRRRAPIAGIGEPPVFESGKQSPPLYPCLITITSPSSTTYSFPSCLSNPFSRAFPHPPHSNNFCQLITSARINFFSKSV